MAIGGQAGTSSRIEAILASRQGSPAVTWRSEAEVQAVKFGARVTVPRRATALTRRTVTTWFASTTRPICAGGASSSPPALATGGSACPIRSDSTAPACTTPPPISRPAMSRGRGGRRRRRQLCRTGGDVLRQRPAASTSSIRARCWDGACPTWCRAGTRAERAHPHPGARCRSCAAATSGVGNSRRPWATRDDRGPRRVRRDRLGSVHRLVAGSNQPRRARLRRDGSEPRNAAPATTSPFETSLPGVFAVGDVRSGSIKRVASAVGEGSVVVQAVHQYLAAGPGTAGARSVQLSAARLTREAPPVPVPKPPPRVSPRPAPGLPPPPTSTPPDRTARHRPRWRQDRYPGGHHVRHLWACAEAPSAFRVSAVAVVVSGGGVDPISSGPTIAIGHLQPPGISSASNGA